MRIYGRSETKSLDNSFVPSSRGGTYNTNNPDNHADESNGEIAHNVIQFDERGECDYYDEESPLVHRNTTSDSTITGGRYYHGGNIGDEGEDSNDMRLPRHIHKTHLSSSSSHKTAVSVASLFTLGLILLGVIEVYHGGFSWSKNMSNNVIGGVTAPISSLNEVQRKESPAPNKRKHKWDGYHEVCTLNSKARDDRNFCASKTTKLTVIGDHNGKWPQGFSWTVLKDGALDTDKTFFHTEKGEFDSDLVKGKAIKCRQYVTELCLTGDYVVYANSDDELSATSAVNVCNKEVAAGEALDFSTQHSACKSSSFELDPDFSRFKNKRNKDVTVLQALSMSGVSGASMMSGATGASFSGASITSTPSTDDYEGSMPPAGSMAPVEGGPGKEEETTQSTPVGNKTTELPPTNEGGNEEPANTSTEEPTDEGTGPANSTSTEEPTDEGPGPANTTSTEEPSDDDGTGPVNTTSTRKPSADEGTEETEEESDPDEQKADDDSEQEDIAPGIYCSITYGCNDDEVGSFCNYDEGKSGMCESCGPYEFPSDCDSDGLPDAGAEDCKKKCFKPAGIPTIEPTAEPTESWELVWPPAAQEFVNETLAGFKYPTFEPTIAPTNLHNSSCYMFGLICQEDFTNLGWTSAPTSSPTAFPTYIDEVTGDNVTTPRTECYMFGLICPTVTSTPTQSPTATPALRMIDLSKKEKKESSIHEVETKVESEANDALEIPKKTTKKAQRLDSEETFKDQELSAYFEDEEDNFSDLKMKAKSSKSRKSVKKYNSSDGKEESKKNVRSKKQSSLKSRS